MAEFEKHLIAGLNRLALPCSRLQMQQSLTFLDVLRLWSGRINLLSETNSSHDQLVEHFIDSLTLLPLYRQIEKKHNLPPYPAQLLDLGSGNGFPALPLAIFWPQTSVILFERSQNKRFFLQRAIAGCRLSNRIYVESDIKRFSAPADSAILTCRAVGQIKKIVGLIPQALYDALDIALYKGRRNQVESEISRLNDAARWHIYPVRLSGSNKERHLVLRFQTHRT